MFPVIMNRYTHPKDCTCRKEAAADRKDHDALAKAREKRQQVVAHAQWFDSGTVPHR